MDASRMFRNKLVSREYLLSIRDALLLVYVANKNLMDLLSGTAKSLWVSGDNGTNGLYNAGAAGAMPYYYEKLRSALDDEWCRQFSHLASPFCAAPWQNALFGDPAAAEVARVLGDDK